MKREPGVEMQDSEAEELIAQEIRAGHEYVYGVDNIAAERDRNYDYYRGIMNDLPVAEGRSAVMELTVAEYIGMMKPNLLRIFTGGRNVAEYVTAKEGLQDEADLVTRFINDIVFRKDNRGELLFNDWADDALVQKLGTAMWWWEDRKESRDEIREELTDGDMLLLAAELFTQGGEIVEYDSETVVIGSGTMEAVEQTVHTVKVRTWENKSKCCIDIIPPEEFVVSRDARTLEDAVLKAHTTGVMIGDLVALGYDFDKLKDLPAYTDPYYDNTNKYNRDIGNDPNRRMSPDPMLRKVGITRGIVYCDYDGTGTKDWYFVVGGDIANPKLLEMEQYNHQIGFADFCPEPMPHTMYGRCPADRLAALQKIKTVLIRQANDNLFLSNTPQREVVIENIMKPDQLMNLAPGTPIFSKDGNSIREMAVPFVAGPAFQALQYYDGRAELTSGVSRNTVGLDPQALQGTSATASANMQSNMLGRTEMIARIWAQGGMRKLFRGVFMCIKAYQDFARVEQINGKMETIDPRKWEALKDIDVNINTGLGTGSRDRDYMLLSSMANIQQQFLEKVGPSPIVDWNKLSRTLQLQAEAAGVGFPDHFFGDAKNPDGSDWQYQPPEPQPSPDTVMNAKSYAESEKLKARTRLAEAKYETDSRERIAKQKNQLDAIIKAKELGIDAADVLIKAAKVDLEKSTQDIELEIVRNAGNA